MQQHRTFFSLSSMSAMLCRVWRRLGACRDWRLGKCKFDHPPICRYVRQGSCKNTAGSCGFLHPTHAFTEECAQWNKTRYCEKGAKCRYIHRSDVVSDPDISLARLRTSTPQTPALHASVQRVSQFATDSLFNLHQDVCPAPFSPPAIGTSFADTWCPDIPRNTNLAPLTTLINGEPELFLNHFTSDDRIRVFCRRRALKEIWNYSHDQSEYFRTHYRSPLHATRHPSGALLIEQTRSKFISKEEGGAQLRMGVVFEAMCSPPQPDPSIATFTTTRVVLGDTHEIVCMGETDCRELNSGCDIELKLTSNARYFDLLAQATGDPGRTENRLWELRAGLLAGTDLVRGLRDPTTDTLVKLMRVTQDDMLLMETDARWEVLQQRLAFIDRAVRELGVRYRVGFDDASSCLTVCTT